MGRSHLSFCNIWVQYPRNIRIDFTSSFYESCLTFLVPRPTILPYSWLSFFNGFSIELWIGILTVFVFFTIISWIIGKLNEIILKEENENLTTSSIFIDLIGILTTGNSIPNSNVPGYTILLTSWALFGLNIAAIYSSDLVSVLTVPQYTARIETPEDFVAANLTWGTFRPVDLSMFDSNQESHKKIISNFHAESDEHPEAVAMKVEGGRYAILMINQGGGIATVQLGINDFPVRKMRLMRKNCIYKPFIAFGFPNNSPYKYAIDRMIVRLFETGIYNYVKKKTVRPYYPLEWESMFSDTDSSPDNTPVILTISQMNGVFYMLFVGLSLSILAFFGELIIYKFFI